MDAIAIIPDVTSDAAPQKHGVNSVRPVKPGSMQRKNRWKRSGRSVRKRRITVIAVTSVVVLAFIAFVQLNAGTVDNGPKGAVAKTVYAAFPEADPQRIEVVEESGIPSTVTLHLPAHMIEPSRGIGDPFTSLGVEFGRAERTLSGVKMAARIEQIAATVLPSDMVKCYTYDVGTISSPPEARHRTRSLYLYLNPTC